MEQVLERLVFQGAGHKVTQFTEEIQEDRPALRNAILAWAVKNWNSK